MLLRRTRVSSGRVLLEARGLTQQHAYAGKPWSALGSPGAALRWADQHDAASIFTKQPMSALSRPSLRWAALEQHLCPVQRPCGVVVKVAWVEVAREALTVRHVIVRGLIHLEPGRKHKEGE